MPVLDTSLDTRDPCSQHLTDPLDTVSVLTHILAHITSGVTFKGSNLQETLTVLDSMECTQAASLESATRITRAPTASQRPQNAPRGSTTQTSRASAYGHETLAGGKTDCSSQPFFPSMTDHHSVPYSQG